MICLAGLMLAHHQGLQSLGRVLVIGLGCCSFTSLVVVPAATALLAGRPEQRLVGASEHTEASQPDAGRNTLRMAIPLSTDVKSRKAA
jgi:hypothetical protein